EELTSVIYTSLMSMMRLTFKQDEAAMDIDEEFEGNLEIDKGDNNSEQFVKESDEKPVMPCRTYTTSQTVDFIGLIFDQAQVKNAAAKTGITLSTAY
ncbi:hypothetical protein BCV71DRAFT_167984, partial [Rhizopus microsporus]